VEAEVLRTAPERNGDTRLTISEQFLGKVDAHDTEFLLPRFGERRDAVR